MKGKSVMLGGLGIVAALLGVYLLFRQAIASSARNRQVIAYLNDPASFSHLEIKAQTRCQQAPFILPTDGMIGFLWDDSFRPGHHHQGIDIFGGKAAGITPVYAAYGGYLTRAPDWKASLIIRIPSDPLQADQQIWTYYTHLADPDGNSLIVPSFPPGTEEQWVEAGALLGYQGNFSGKTGQPTGVHLHFSIVRDDGQGHYLNELEIDNTLDPSPYFGLNLNGRSNKNRIPTCLVP